MFRSKDNQVTSVETANTKWFRRRPKWLSGRRGIAAAACLIIIVAVGGWMLYANHRQAAKKPTITVPKGISSTQKAQYLADAGQYKAAEQAWQQQSTTTTDKTDKLGIYYQQSLLATQSKNYADAKKYAEDGVQLDSNSPQPYAALAELAQAQHNNALAKKYWQQAIDHVTSDMPGYNLIRGDYQSNLNALQ